MQAHNPKVARSNLATATTEEARSFEISPLCVGALVPTMAASKGGSLPGRSNLPAKDEREGLASPKHP
jgi:hypothetical protein